MTILYILAVILLVYSAVKFGIVDGDYQWLPIYVILLAFVTILFCISGG